MVESRTETVDSAGERFWTTSRTIYDQFGRSSVSTAAYTTPIDHPIGTGDTPPLVVSVNRYDDEGRSIAVERYREAVVSLEPLAGASFSPMPELTEAGQLESVSETLYDAAGRPYRSLGNRVPQDQLPAGFDNSDALPPEYPVRDGLDPYSGLNLTPGVLTDTLFDDEGRAFGALGHPVLAASVGLTGSQFDGKLVRHRTETIFDRHDNPAIERSGLAQIETVEGVVTGLEAADSMDMVHQFDPFGNVLRTDYVVEGEVSGATTTAAGQRSGGRVDSFTMTEYDERKRPIAVSQQTDGEVEVQWDAAAETFVATNFTLVSAPGQAIPTTLSRYDGDDRLIAVELPAVADPSSGLVAARPVYQYTYNERGQQSAILDPNGHTTRFTYDARGQQTGRQLPLHFGPDGVAGHGKRTL